MEWLSINKSKRKYKWYKWFAWYPVCVRAWDNGDKKKVWLKSVERKDGYCKEWIREIGSTDSYYDSWGDTQ